jgi:SPP1 family predicted phage head-tail adaptor
LRMRLTLEAPSRAGDGGGGAATSWATVSEVWGAVRPTSGAEGFELDRIAGTVTHEIVLRYRPDVTPEMRLRSGTRIFDIRSVFDPDARRRWLTCLAEERDL